MIFICQGSIISEHTKKTVSQANINTRKIGSTTIYFSDNYLVKNLDEEIQLYIGNATFKKIPVDLELIEHSGAQHIFPLSIGPFFFLKVTPHEIEVYNSLCRTVDLFYQKTAHGFELSTELSILLRPTLHKQVHINASYCINFLLGNSYYGGETAFHAIHQVILGGKYVFGKNGVRRDFMPPSAVIQKNQSLVNLLGDNLEAISKEFKKLTLNFSGGLDSSFVFAVMSHKNIEFEAEHHLPTEGEHSTEADIAEDYCKKFNKKLKKVIFDGVVKLAPPSKKIVNSPYDIPIYGVDSGREHTPQYCVVDGHGGDNVFLQNPPYMIGSDVLKKSGIGLALKKTMQLSALKKSNFYKLLALNLLTYTRIWRKFTPYVIYPDWLPRSGDTQQLHHPLLRNHDPGGAKFEHIKRMLFSLYSTTQGGVREPCSFSPLLFQNIIAFMIECECEATYSAHLDRLSPRKELSKLTDAPIITRTQKKPSTDLIFCLLQDNAKTFRNFLIDGRLIKTLKINSLKLNSSIIGNTETGLTDDLQFLLRLYQLESYFSPFPDICFGS